MIKISSILAYLVTPLTLMAEPGGISGAFGLQLGQKIDVAGFDEIGTGRDGGIRYGFTPATPYGPLSDYSVFVTPKTRRIYHIAASGNFASMKDCREELLRLEAALSKKYVKTSKAVSTRFGDIPKITFGTSSRKIEAVCKGVFNRRELALKYFDQKLAKVAKKEANELEKENRKQDGNGTRYDEGGL